MNPDEYAVMARAEQCHWWYLGLRDLLARRLADLAAAGTELRVLDAGCGTGANLALLQRLLRPSFLGGFDLAAEALETARDRVPEAEIYRSDICDPRVAGAPLDLVLSLDVIYIPGVARALPGLRRLAAALKPGGRLIMNLPAYDWLYSRHDVAVHTRERYTTRRVRSLIEELGLVPEVLTYRLCLLFPLVVARRLPGKILLRRGSSDTRSDLVRVPPAWLNRALLGALRLENGWIAAGASMPWGSSVFVQARKP